MVTVTEDAKVLLSETLDDMLAKVELPSPAPERDQIGLRLVVQDHALALGLDACEQQDQVIEYDGIPVLLISPEVSLILGEVVLDTIDTQEGKKLTISKVGNA